MATQDLKQQKCQPCESGAPALTEPEVRSLLKQLSGWTMTADKKGIQKMFLMKDFMAAVEFIKKIADVAESEDHHPDLHLTGYRRLGIELSTHSIGGLSNNDFIVAAKIDDLPKNLKI